MNGKFTTYVEDDQGVEHQVLVHYSFTPPRPATYTEPPEGGVEIEDIVSPVRLTQAQSIRVEQECVDYAYECWRERDVP